MIEQTTITISIPSQLLEQIQSLETETESLNDLVTHALEKEIKERKAWKAHQTILNLRQTIKKTTGIHPDPVPLIRQLREGENYE